MINNHKFLLGDKLMVCDFVVGSLYTDLVDNPNAYGREDFSKVCRDYPAFKQFGEAFKESMSFYLKKRGPAPL